jgi:hypothetical protein
MTIVAAVRCYGDPATFCAEVNRAIAGNWSNLQQADPKRKIANDDDCKLTEEDLK